MLQPSGSSVFIYCFLKRQKKKREKGFPITYSFSSPTKLPARTKFFQNLHFDRKAPPFLLSLLPCYRGQSLSCGQERSYGTVRAGERVLEEEQKL